MTRTGMTMLLTLLGTTLPALAAPLRLGDPAPPLEITAWIKGKAVDFAAGKGKNVYVIEFWATWCGPCIESVPHLTKLQQQYKDKNVTIVGITDEPEGKVKQFVKKMGDKMNYVVACDGKDRTHNTYMLASGQMGIPTAFIVDQQGRVVWIGSPFFLDGVLEQVVNGSYNLEQAIADEDFFRMQHFQLMTAMQTADWQGCLRIARKVAEPGSPMSKMLRSQILHAVAWTMLTDERADKKYFKDALDLARAAYDNCGCDEPSIIDTYARALFDNGRVQEAVQYQRQAVERATDGMMKAELQEALNRYEMAAKGG